MLTVTDHFCGAGGSSSGAERVPGVRVETALNHWQLALDTHNANMPHVRHDKVDLSNEDNPGRWPTTDIGWFSPECTYWSQARGDGKDADTSYQQRALDDEDDEPLSEEAKVRSRAQMEDVIKFTRHHRYRAVVVENVPDILKWIELDRWLAEMDKEGYEHRIVILNSAFAGALGAPAPQLRDRVYFVFWQKRYRAPDFAKWTRPRAWCGSCDQVVHGVYAPKPGKRRPMRYGSRAQYVFRCPHTRCRGAVVAPYVLPARAAIDFTLPAERIGDRVTPLRPNTMARIEAGLRRYAGYAYDPDLACPMLLVPAGGTRRRDAANADRPMPARTTRENDGIVVPPLLVPTEGRDGVFARPVTGPHRAQTARLQDALVIPLRNNGVGRPAATHPATTFAASGTHHALVMRCNTARGDQGQMSTPVGEPLRTITGGGRQALLGWDHLLYSYDTGLLRPLVDPLPTQTVVEGDALLGHGLTVEDCTFRMLDVHEIQAGMAFAPEFVLLGTAKRDKIKMLGNAVTPPAARDLIAMVVEAVTGDDIDLADAA